MFLVQQWHRLLRVRTTDTAASNLYIQSVLLPRWAWGWSTFAYQPVLETSGDIIAVRARFALGTDAVNSAVFRTGFNLTPDLSGTLDVCTMRNVGASTAAPGAATGNMRGSELHCLPPVCNLFITTSNFPPLVNVVWELWASVWVNA